MTFLCVIPAKGDIQGPADGMLVDVLNTGRRIIRLGSVHYLLILLTRVRPHHHLCRCGLRVVEAMVEGVRFQITAVAGVRLQTVEARHQQVGVRLGYML